MSAIVYLNFSGEAQQAVEFYKEVFSAVDVKKVQFKDFPQDPNYPLPEQELDMVMEAVIQFEGGIIMLSDVLPSMQTVTGPLLKGNNVLVSLVIEDKVLLKQYFDKLCIGGYVIMPLSETPWSSCFGLLVDKFGVNWKFNRDAFTFLDKVISNK